MWLHLTFRRSSESVSNNKSRTRITCLNSMFFRSWADCKVTEVRLVLYYVLCRNTNSVTIRKRKVTLKISTIVDCSRHDRTGWISCIAVDLQGGGRFESLLVILLSEQSYPELSLFLHAKAGTIYWNRQQQSFPGVYLLVIYFPPYSTLTWVTCDVKISLLSNSRASLYQWAAWNQ